MSTWDQLDVDGPAAYFAPPRRSGPSALPPAPAPSAPAPTDRAAVMMDLARRFEIVDRPTWGGAPNAITKDELAKLVSMYQDIALGRGDLTIDTTELSKEDAQATRDGMMENIARLMQTDVGRYELRHLTDNVTMEDGKPVHHKTTLRALHANPNDSTSMLAGGNALTIPKRGADGSYHYDEERRVAGRGTDVTVMYTPQGQFPADERSDVTLAHELVHALEYTSGQDDTAPVGKDDRVPADAACRTPPNRGEHQATGLGLYENTNINENSYRIERRLLGRDGAAGALDDDAAMTLRDHYGCVEL